MLAVDIGALDGLTFATLMGNAARLGVEAGGGVALDGRGDYLDLGENLKLAAENGLSITFWMRDQGSRGAVIVQLAENEGDGSMIA